MSLEGGKKFDIMRNETKLFKALYLEVNLDALKNPVGEISNIVLALRDVTDVRREEMMKQDFLSLMSHKLLTPISVISGNLSIISDEIPESRKRIFENTIREAGVLENLIQKLLKFTKSHLDNEGLAKERINLSDYLPPYFDNIISGKKGKKIELSIDCQKDAEVLMNKGRLKMMLDELFDNAIKFNDKEIIKIGISAKKAGGKVEISISDNGRGIPQEEKDKILLGFYQVEKYFTGNVEGLGLGLLIVRSIVNAFEGEIEINSKISEGTSVLLRFPGIS